MKIKIVVYTKDKKYIEKISEYYQFHHDKLEMYDVHLFSSQEKTEQYLAQNPVDVILADEQSNTLLSKCEDVLCAYLTGDNAINSVNGVKAIGKYQKIENIFKEIFAYFVEESKTGAEYSFSKKRAKMVLFYHSAGGVGCTTIAVACAMALAEKEKKVLYFNMELAGVTEAYFQEEQKKDFSEVIYAVKSGSNNLAMKVLSCVASDRSHVQFFKSSQNIPDMLELSAADMELLLDTLASSCDFDYVVIDTDTGIDEKIQIMMQYVESIVFVLEANDVSQKKYERCMKGLHLLDTLNKTKHTSKIKVLYNKYHETQRVQVDSTEVLGGIPDYGNLSAGDIAMAMSKMAVFEKF